MLEKFHNWLSTTLAGQSILWLLQIVIVVLVVQGYERQGIWGEVICFIKPTDWDI